jgi:hypothetical protein
VEILRHAAKSLDHFAEGARGDGGADRFVGIRRLENGGGSGKASAAASFLIAAASAGVTVPSAASSSTKISLGSECLLIAL